MFYLGGSDFPTTREQLAAAVTDGLREALILPSREVVKIEGGKFPAFDHVTVDMTAARYNTLPPQPRGTGQRLPGVFTARLEVLARPIYAQQAAIDLSLSANEVSFDFDRDPNGRPLLMLARASDGRAAVQIKKQDLDTLVLLAAREGAARHGVEIVSVHMVLTQLEPRTLSLDLHVKAKKMFLTATVNLHGKASIDDALTARVYDLSCNGEGMLGRLAGTMLGPHLQKINGQSYPLIDLSLGQVRLRDIGLQVGDSIKLTIAFGS